MWEVFCDVDDINGVVYLYIFFGYWLWSWWVLSFFCVEELWGWMVDVRD